MRPGTVQLSELDEAGSGNREGMWRALSWELYSSQLHSAGFVMELCSSLSIRHTIGAASGGWFAQINGLHYDTDYDCDHMQWPAW